MAIGARILALEASLRQARDGYAYQANHDPLTGLLTRLAITNHVRAELSRADRNKYPLGLALLDFDYFKQVNDCHGHLVGDQALCSLAQTLKAALRPYDWIGRWGGEGFLIVLANTVEADALMVAERLRVQVAETPFQLANGSTIPLTVSIGVACIDQAEGDEVDSELLFQEADRALYAAKSAGRNRVRAYMEDCAVALGS